MRWGIGVRIPLPAYDYSISHSVFCCVYLLLLLYIRFDHSHWTRWSSITNRHMDDTFFVVVVNCSMINVGFERLSLSDIHKKLMKRKNYSGTVMIMTRTAWVSVWFCGGGIRFLHTPKNVCGGVRYTRRMTKELHIMYKVHIYNYTNHRIIITTTEIAVHASVSSRK